MVTRLEPVSVKTQDLNGGRTISSLAHSILSLPSRLTDPSGLNYTRESPALRLAQHPLCRFHGGMGACVSRPKVDVRRQDLDLWFTDSDIQSTMWIPCLHLLSAEIIGLLPQPSQLLHGSFGSKLSASLPRAKRLPVYLVSHLPGPCYGFCLHLPALGEVYCPPL